MDQKRNNIRTMFETTIKFLDDNNSVWSGTPPFAEAVTRVKAGIDALGAASDAQEKPTAGLTVDKAQLRSDLEEKTLKIADQLAALAAKNQKGDLAAQVRVTRSSLDQLGDLDLEQTAERIALLANLNFGALADYGILPADVTALDTARTAFVETKAVPREAVAQREAQNESLSPLIANVRSVFRNEIDKMMSPFKKSDPDFYHGYIAVRVVVDRAAPATPPAPPPTQDRQISNSSLKMLLHFGGLFC
jgi:hypothetical protein